jgi:hypothetical protein
VAAVLAAIAGAAVWAWAPWRDPVVAVVSDAGTPGLPETSTVVSVAATEAAPAVEDEGGPDESDGAPSDAGMKALEGPVATLDGYCRDYVASNTQSAPAGPCMFGPGVCVPRDPVRAPPSGLRSARVVEVGLRGATVLELALETPRGTFLGGVELTWRQCDDSESQGRLRRRRGRQCRAPGARQLGAPGALHRAVLRRAPPGRYGAGRGGRGPTSRLCSHLPQPGRRTGLRAAGLWALEGRPVGLALRARRPNPRGRARARSRLPRSACRRST